MLIKKLTESGGISGREKEIRDLIKAEISADVDKIDYDPMGNMFAYKNLDQKPLVMLAAHMDEVGFMIMGIDKTGGLDFAPVGGIDPRIVVGKNVLVGANKTPGVIGAKPIHFQRSGERDKPFALSELFIDIGANSEEEAQKLAKVGDEVIFATKTEELSSSTLKGKAFDDRAGCAAIIELLKADISVGLCGAFTVQEEVGLRGAQTAAYNVNPDLAIVLEGTTASDVPPSKEHRYSTTLGMGPALTIMDRSFIANQKINQHVQKLAEQNNIKYQLRRSNIGGTDAGRIHLSKEGIPTIGLSLPCRYIHSPASIMSINDYNQLIAWVKVILNNIAQGGFPFARTY